LLAKDFESLPFQDPSLCIINNADAKVLTSGSEVKTSLIRQLSLSLLWEDSIQKMIEMGADCFIEVGPGKVLSGLIRKIDRNKKIFHVDDNKSLSTTIETLRS
jgi:[acyl-carrier-protein] S-malonyltransferase